MSEFVYLYTFHIHFCGWDPHSVDFGCSDQGRLEGERSLVFIINVCKLKKNFGGFELSALVHICSTKDLGE